MFEVGRWPANTSGQPRTLGAKRFYEILTVIHCAHLIPIDASNSVFYVNNWINWEAYNTIYGPDFLALNHREAVRLGELLR